MKFKTFINAIVEKTNKLEAKNIQADINKKLYRLNKLFENQVARIHTELSILSMDAESIIDDTFKSINIAQKSGFDVNIDTNSMIKHLDNTKEELEMKVEKLKSLINRL